MMMPENQPSSTICSCGAEQATDARFCAECGDAVAHPGALSTDLPTQQLTAGHHTMLLAKLPGQSVLSPLLSTIEPVEMAAGVPHDAPHKPRRWLIVKGLVAVLVLTAVALLAINDFGTHQELAKSRGAFSASQTHLQSTQVKLADTVTQLTGAKSNLASTEATLTTTKATLTTTQKTLAAKVQELSGVRNNLTDVKSSLTIKSGQIETLKSCLNGVSIALRDLANGDYAGTISALDAVQVSCDSAFAMF